MTLLALVYLRAKRKNKQRKHKYWDKGLCRKSSSKCAKISPKSKTIVIPPLGILTLHKKGGSVVP